LLLIRLRGAVDKVARRELLWIFQVHAVLHGALHLQEALAHLIACQLADGAHATIAQVVDVVDFAYSRAKAHDVLDGLYQILGAQCLLLHGHVVAELAVHAEASDGAQLVAIGIEEFLADSLPGLLHGEGRSRPQFAVQLLDGGFMVAAAVLGQGIQNQRVEFLRQHFDLFHAALDQLLSRLLGYAVAGLEQRDVFVLQLNGDGADAVAESRAGRAFGKAHLLGFVEELQQVGVGRALGVKSAQN